MGAVVVAQYCSRMLAGATYLQMGSGLSNLTGPSLFFLAPGYQPMFYVDKLLLSENHVLFYVDANHRIAVSAGKSLASDMSLCC